jgi:predicted ATPase/class 3 adenylate cyclase
LIPSGTVTFLFTDIEGSTALAQAYPDEMHLLLERHHAILRQSIEAHNGFVFRITGDAFAAAFHTSQEAVLAASDAQRGLLQEAWHPVPVRVRMGIHTGAAEAGSGDQVGDSYAGYLTLTRVQRVMSAAHGGQVLLSSASAELVRGQLPEEASLRDLGEHRLKGLVNPERLWQLVVPGLPSEFPPLASYNAIPNNLPAQPTALVGREAELGEIVQRLASEGVRLVTLTGPGGIGKTRMALQAAAELIEQFENGVYFIDLAPIRDPDDFPAAIAQTLGLRETSDRPLLAELTGHLLSRTVLLLLDNFEQVTAAAPQVAELVRACPRLKLLVTSREALHIRGEYVYPVPPLALPRVDLKQTTIEQLSQYEAVRLFIERAQAVRPDFNITNENAPAVAEICWRLDGLPLAIELAAARIRLFSPQALLERLGHRLQLLKGGARDLPVRQQTLRDAIDWSYEILDRGEQRLFALLSVFSGGCSFEAVEATAGQVDLPEGPGLEVLDSLLSLVDKSLIRQVERENGESRLLMLETIREYAAERLEADPGFSAAARRAHAAYFAAFTQRQWERLAGAEREVALAELSADLENVRTAWEYWAGEKDLEQLGLFVDSLWLLYDWRGWYHLTIELTVDMLDILKSLPPTPERIQQEILLQTSLARALQVIKGYTGEVEQAYTRALELSREVGEIPELFPVLRGLGSLYGYIADFEKAGQMAEKILSLAERLDDSGMQVEGHLRLGYSLAFTGDIQLGLEHLERAISGFDLHQYGTPRYQLGSHSAVVGLNVSALLLWMVGSPDRALERANNALALAGRLNHPYSLAYALFHAGLLHLWRREFDLAGERSQAALDLAGEHEFLVWKAVAGCLLGAALAGKGQPEQGLEEVRRGIASYQGLNTPPVFWPLLVFMESEVCGLAGKPEQGLALLDRSSADTDPGSKNIFSIEFFRLKGDLLLAISPNNEAEAELQYLHASKIAQELGVPMLELRAIIRLCRLWQNLDKAELGRQLLSDGYKKFNEGFNTADLIEARDLITSRHKA